MIEPGVVAIRRLPSKPPNIKNSTMLVNQIPSQIRIVEI